MTLMYGDRAFTEVGPDMTKPACLLCGSRDNEKRFSEHGYDLLVCRNCELFFIDPYPTSTAEVHERVVDYSYENLEIVDVNKHYRGERQYYTRYFPLIFEQCKGASSVLDVGCGTGHLLELLRRVPGLERAGLELNSARAEKARKVAGCEIYQVPIEEFKSEHKFDVITMINVLSHIPSLDSLFKSVRSLLSPEGKLILKVGEMRPDVTRSDIVDWGLPDHLHFLGLNTLDLICSKYGFRAQVHRRVPYSYDFFSPERWRVSGRSRVRNVIKRIAVNTPFALPAMARIHHKLRGGRIFSSFIVLTPASQDLPVS